MTLLSPSGQPLIDNSKYLDPKKIIWSSMNDVDAVMDYEIDHNVKYGWDGKPKNTLFPPTWTEIGPDCSGLIEYLAKRAGLIKFPEGSFTEDDWLAAQGYKKSDYANCGIGDNIIRIAVHKPNGLDKIGHIWGIFNGMSFESCGEFGPHRRAWNSSVLLPLVTDCYAVGFVPVPTTT